MAQQIYMYFLMLFAILCQGIIASLDEEDTRASLDFIVRKRRVINHLPDGLTVTRIAEVNYMVNIKENKRSRCAGAILSHYTVITAALCIRLDIINYAVLSGSGFDNRSLRHIVTSKVDHNNNHAAQQHDDITLITIDPSFHYNSNTGYIQLYVGSLATGTQATVSGWGYDYPLRPGISGVQRRLRTITLGIMNHTECHNLYRSTFVITEKHICGCDRQQYCARSDIGTPLVINNMLAGIHVWKGEYFNHSNPEVFINLQHGDYPTWIRRNSILI